MEKQLYRKLLKKSILTEEQLQAALARKKLHGGTITSNLIALKLIDRETLLKLMKTSPPVPKSVEETGLTFSFIADLVMKHVLFMGEFTIGNVADKLKLPYPIVEKVIDNLRDEHFMEVKRATQLHKASYQFSITDLGRTRSNTLLDVCRYVGPAPVPLEQYRHRIEMQTVKNIIVNPKSFRQAFSHLVVDEQVLKRLGPAVTSSRAIFLYGPPGNGKTTIAETIGKILPGHVYMPHALLVNGDIITVYDAANHIAVDPEAEAEETDGRWVYVRRPVVLAGGELTLRTLDLEFNPVSKFYEAPLQMKANNGLFIVDDFGRQQMEPEHLMNRWIVPLERRTDLLTLQTGMKFEIPFDQIVIFATNLKPQSLVDEAFLRRIPYKIKIDHPTLGQYAAIFLKICQANDIAFKKDVFDDLIANYYGPTDIKPNACHPKDIIENIIDDAHFHGKQPEMTREIIGLAWQNYFVDR
jgi:MoxR-like ATPase